MADPITTTHSYTVTAEQWKRALTMPRRPPLTRRQRFVLWIRGKRYDLACWISPYGMD